VVHDHLSKSIDRTTQNLFSFATLFLDMCQNLVSTIVELQAVEFTFELPDLPAIGIHLLLGALLVFVDLLYDDFGVTIGQQTLDAECGDDPEAVHEGLVLGSIIGGLEE